MADYKRLVSYMYLYEEGKKKNNIGYARVETRNGQCKYTIHVTVLGLNDKQLKAYSFKRNSSGIEGVLLGNLLIKNNTGDFKIVTDATHIMNSPYGLEDMGGIVLVFSDRKFVAAEWDGKPITISMIANLENKANTSIKTDTSKTTEASNLADTINAEKSRAAEENKKEEEIKAATLAEVLFEYSKTPVEEEIQKESRSEIEGDKSLKDLLTPNFSRIIDQKEMPGSQQKEARNRNIEEAAGELLKDFTAVPPLENLVNTPPENAAVKPSEPLQESPKENKTETSARTENMEEPVVDQQKEVTEGNRPQDNENKTNTESLSSNKPIFDDHPLAKQIYHNFPKMYPFEDNEIAWCARIEPKDIGMLPMDLWGLGNNSFLLHGYYSYRHLIFARVNDKNGQNYILGVPGIYHNREKFMAKMFGFENFKCAKRKPQRTGEFGYWYIPVLLNRGN